MNYILSLKPNKKDSKKALPSSGTIEFKDHIGSKNEGMYVLMASYIDKGASGQADSEISSRAQILFKTPKTQAQNASKKSDGLTNWTADGNQLVGSITHNSYLKFDAISLKGLKAIKFSAYYTSMYDYKGTVEIREGAFDGKLIGKSKLNYYNKKKGSSKEYKIKVSPTTDKSSIYLVFKNTKNKDKYITNANWIELSY